MGVSASASRVFTAGYAAVFEAALRAAGMAGMTVSRAQPATGGLRLQTSRSFASCGEDIELQLEQADSGRTVVNARSTLLAGSDDWGKNTRNLDKLFEILDADLHDHAAAASAQGVAVGTSTGQSHGPSQGQDEPAGRSSRFVAWALSHANPLSPFPDPDGAHRLYWEGRAWVDHDRDARPAAEDPIWLTLFKDPSATQAQGGSGNAAR